MNDVKQVHLAHKGGLRSGAPASRFPSPETEEFDELVGSIFYLSCWRQMTKQTWRYDIITMRKPKANTTRKRKKHNDRDRPTSRIFNIVSKGRL